MSKENRNKQTNKDNTEKETSTTNRQIQQPETFYISFFKQLTDFYVQLIFYVINLP